MKLTIRGPEGYKVDVTKQGEYKIGRKGFVALIWGVSEEPKEIAIGHKSVSRDHLDISIDKVLTLTDLNSTFGSYLDKEKFDQIDLQESGQYNLKLGNVEFLLFYER